MQVWMSKVYNFLIYSVFGLFSMFIFLSMCVKEARAKKRKKETEKLNEGRVQTTKTTRQNQTPLLFATKDYMRKKTLVGTLDHVNTLFVGRICFVTKSPSSNNSHTFCY